MSFCPYETSEYKRGAKVKINGQVGFWIGRAYGKIQLIPSFFTKEECLPYFLAFDRAHLEWLKKTFNIHKQLSQK